MGISKLQGCPWHIEYLKKGDKEPRRLRSKCVFFHTFDKTCLLLDKLCPGVTYCKSFSQKVSSLREVFPIPSDCTVADPIKIYGLLTNIAQRTKDVLNTCLLNPANTTTKEHKELFSQLVQYIGLEGIHVRSKDIRCFIYITILAYDHKYFSEFSAESLLPYVLDILWAASSSYDYNIRTLPQSRNIKTDLIQFISCNDFETEINNHQPTKCFKSYVDNLHLGYSFENMIRYLSLRNPTGL